MAHLYALQGTKNAGKTSTLLELLNQIMAKYPAAVVQNLHGATRDIKVTIDVPNGKRIGIESRGDPGSRLRRSLIDFHTSGCDIIFCACRTRGDTVSWVNAMSPHYNVRFIKQTASVGNLQAANIAKAQLLMGLAAV